MTHVDPSKLVVGAPVVTADATVTVAASVTNPVDPGDHLFQLIVVDENGVESIPAEQKVTISPDDRKPQAVLTATGALHDAQHLDAEQLYDHRWLARALSHLHGSGTLAGLEVTWEKATGGRSERLVVKPGIALDRLGRIIEVPRDAYLPLDRWL